jgi:hypothetical protein
LTSLKSFLTLNIVCPERSDASAGRRQEVPRLRVAGGSNDAAGKVRFDTANFFLHYI